MPGTTLAGRSTWPPLSRRERGLGGWELKGSARRPKPLRNWTYRPRRRITRCSSNVTRL